MSLYFFKMSSNVGGKEFPTTGVLLPTFVKLHSELALPTELQLDRVGVDFVFPLSQVTK